MIEETGKWAVDFLGIFVPLSFLVVLMFARLRGYTFKGELALMLAMICWWAAEIPSSISTNISFVAIFRSVSFILFWIGIMQAWNERKKGFLLIEALASDVPEAVIIVDDKGKVSFANASARKLFGLDEGHSLEDFASLACYALNEEENMRLQKLWCDAVRLKEKQVLQQWFLRKPGGEVVPVEVVIVPTNKHWIVRIKDIRQWVEQEQRYERLIAEDPLTGLLNRRGFQRAARQEIARAERYRHPLAVVMLDLDHFKKINDRFGHQIGDQVLQALAHRIRSLMRSADLAARWGGEEFVILLPETDAEGAVRFATRLLDALRKTPINTNAGTISITASLGIAAFPQDGKTIEELISRADQAMYRAKQTGRAKVMRTQDLAHALHANARGVAK